MTRLGLLGGGGQALEAAEFDSSVDIAFRAVSAPSDGFIDIRTDDPALTGTPVVAAVGAPGLRRVLVQQWGSTREFGSIISPFSWISPSASIGVGAIVAPGVVVTAGAAIGEHVILNVGSSISHTSSVGDFVTVSPGARVAGDCVIGDGVFLGIGAVVSHGVTVAPGSVIGAGSTVVSNIDRCGVWVGSPARLVRATDEWLMALS